LVYCISAPLLPFLPKDSNDACILYMLIFQPTMPNDHKIMIVYTSASDVYCRKLHDWLPCGIWPREARIGMEEIWLSVLFSSLYANFCSHTLMPERQMLTVWALNRLWHGGSQCDPYKTTHTRRCASCCRCRAWSLPFHGFNHKVQIQLSEVNCITTATL